MNTSFKDVSHKSGIAAKEGLMEPLFQVKNTFEKKISTYNLNFYGNV